MEEKSWAIHFKFHDKVISQFCSSLALYLPPLSQPLAPFFSEPPPPFPPSPPPPPHSPHPPPSHHSHVSSPRVEPSPETVADCAYTRGKYRPWGRRPDWVRTGEAGWKSGQWRGCGQVSRSPEAGTWERPDISCPPCPRSGGRWASWTGLVAGGTGSARGSWRPGRTRPPRTECLQLPVAGPAGSLYGRRLWASRSLRVEGLSWVAPAPSSDGKLAELPSSRAHCARALRCGGVTADWLLAYLCLTRSPGIQFSLTIQLVSWKRGSAKMLQICGYFLLAVCLLYPSLVYGECGRLQKERL